MAAKAAFRAGSRMEAGMLISTWCHDQGRKMQANSKMGVTRVTETGLAEDDELIVLEVVEPNGEGVIP